ncbi:MAG: acyl carrier protein [Lachnospiraceae bacterium]|nr:acyl carrier protein [Lachnospiraceae bacterium]
MTREEVYVRLNKIFQSVFDDESIIVNASTCAEDIEDWDSFEHINLVVAVEHEFGIKFNIKEAKNFKNVGEMVEVIMSRGEQ